VTRVRILVVDESPARAETVSALETGNNEVIGADSLAEAQLRMRNHQPDVVVTEHRLPDGDGLDLLRELHSTYEMLPIVVYTAHGNERIASEYIDADVSAYVPKDGERATERLCEAVEELSVGDVAGAAGGGVPEPSPRNIVRAVDEAPVGITLSDPALPDNPLVYANQGYAELTGYDIEEVLGRNCRLLQGPDTDEEPVAKMRAALDDEEPVSVEVLNYRKDGTPFWNRVTLAPLYDGDELSHYIGFQEDVTDRKEAEALARQRADALREERQTLERVLGRVSGLVNNVSHALVAASNREEIEQRVCSEIAATDGYNHAWMGESQVAGTTMTVRVSEGGAQQMETGSSAQFADTVLERALDQGSVVVPTGEDRVPPAVAPEQFDSAAMAVVPLSYRRTTYGVLCVYAQRAEVLDRRESEVFEAVGQMVASGLNAVETKQVLTADRVTELGFEITDDDFPLIELANRTGGAISYNGSTIEDGSSFRLFVTLSGVDVDDPVGELLSAAHGIQDGYVIASRNDTVATSVALADGHPFGELAEYGATVQDLSVSDSSGTAQLHIDLPIEGDSRSVLSALEAAYDGVSLIRQREREREPQPTTAFTTAVADRLTDRQYTALETAFLSDYFEFPRPVSGEELAESMDISRQTYHQHLRAAQRKLLEEFFESN
jgi:PAS domain S-box-containing protein